jgi:23S rRNA pseudouridine2605 synthase
MALYIGVIHNMTMRSSFLKQSLVSSYIRSRLMARVHPCASTSFSSSSDNPPPTEPASTVRLSKLLSRYATNLPISRRKAENMIHEGQVTLAGEVIRKPHLLVNWADLVKNKAILKVQGKAITLSDPSDPKQNIPKVWAVHKLPGELVSESDPLDRPSMMQRLKRGGVGRNRKQRSSIMAIGRLDMSTEGLILLTNDGDFGRQMELPSSNIHRVYRVRVHGHLSTYKLERIRRGGIRHESTVYGPMKVAIERSHGKSTNTWVRVTSVEGKNRQIRNVFKALGGKADLCPFVVC